MRSRVVGASRTEEEQQAPEVIAAAIEEFLATHPRAVMLEDGRAVFEMASAKYNIGSEHARCTLHVWDEQANVVRRVTSAIARAGSLRLSTLRFGQARPQTMELVADRDRRTPSTRELTRTKYLRVLERALMREFPEWQIDTLRAAMDLEKSFGPAYARGVQVRGQHAWAVIGVNPEETQATIDGILTVGILWLEHCRASSGGRRVFQGLRIVVPRGCAALTLSRLPWLNERAAQWELWELDPASEALEQRDAADHGNVTTRLVHAPNRNALRERFAEAISRVTAVVPEEMRGDVEQVIRSGAEMAFLLHGLEFARIRTGYAGNSFNVQEEITLGAGANETPLTAENEGELRELVTRLFERRRADGDKRDPLYRMQPERWLESVLRRDVCVLDDHLNQDHVYTQVPAFVASDRGMLDLLSVLRDGRLAVIELKADEDLHLALQGLDYWIRVRWHHLHGESEAGLSGPGGLQSAGYFGGVVLSNESPKLYLVAPALRIHPATETVLKYLSPRVEWELVAIDERWRKKAKTVWRKRSTELRGV